MVRTILCVLGALAGGLLVTSGLAQSRFTRLSPESRASCLARNGRVLIAGLSGNETCALPLADAGKKCTSGDQCIGDCLLDESKPRPARGSTRRVTGICQPTDYGFGCRTLIERGRIKYNICVD